MKVTEQNAKTLPGPPAGKPYIIHYDDDLKGFGLRVTRAGARSFVLNYRALGVERRLTIGSIPEWKAAGARKEAERLKRGIDVGNDPMRDRHDLREAPTVAQLATRYLEEWAVPKKRLCSVANDRILLNSHILPALGAKRVKDVDYADIEGLHARVTRATPPTANRCVALLSKMFSLAIQWGYRGDNPTKGVQRNAEERREVYLDGNSLERLQAALGEFPGRPSANAIRLLLLTGARRNEVLSATWSQFDLVKGVWTKPSSHTKQKIIHVVPLSKPALALLQQMHGSRTDNEFLFPGRRGGAQSSLKKFWKTVCQRADLHGMRIHDLRHSHASILINAGLSLPVIGKLLGHTNPSTTQRYAHLADETLRAATAVVGEAWAAAGEAGKVVTTGKRHG
jgi:integrase